ncbi:hypothetical protein ACET3Z_002102 [Daucus carota]
MDQSGLVPMLEVTGSSSSHSRGLCVAVPQALEGLQGASPPPFLAKICDLVDDSRTNHIVSWSKGNNSFVIWDPDSFANQLLPKYFKHKVGQFGSEAETDCLQSETKVLRVELVRLRQEHQNTKAHLKAIEFRLRDTEIKQQHIMGFLTRMIRNPSLVQKLFESGRRGELVEAISKTKSKGTDQVCGSVEFREISQGKRQIYVELGSKDLTDAEIPEMNTLSIEMQAVEETSKGSDEGQDGGNNGLDKKFWEDLLNDTNEEELGLFG